MISEANKTREGRQAEPQALARRLHGVAIRLLRRARRHDTAMGLPPGQASALSVLVFGGAQTLSALAALEQVRAPTMTRMVDALERAGHVRREQDLSDRRKVRIVATAAGARLMQSGRERREQVLAKALSGLARSERILLQSALAVLENLPDTRE
jgi:DNA-binding MarR family transcriptional regulator